MTSGLQQEESHNVFIGLTAIGSLVVSGEGGSHQTLAQNASSFIVSSGFLIFTTTAHVAQFVPLSALLDLLEKSQGGAVSADVLPQWETRRVERGSRIVTAVASTMSLVLQMPRGNLETVHPRPLVMRIVHQDIDKCVNAASRKSNSLTQFLVAPIFLKRLLHAESTALISTSSWNIIDKLSWTDWPHSLSKLTMWTTSTCSSPTSGIRHSFHPYNHLLKVPTVRDRRLMSRSTHSSTVFAKNSRRRT